MPESAKEYLRKLAGAFEAAHRQGAEKDVPEGSRYIVFSDTVIIQFAERLREIAGA